MTSDASPSPPPNARHWVLWDGTCGFCRRILAWFRERDRSHRFRDAPYQEAPSPPMTPELFVACARAVHVVTAEGRVLKGGRAVLFMLEATGWGRWARLLARPPLVWGVEALYRLVSEHRGFFARFLFRNRFRSRRFRSG